MSRPVTASMLKHTLATAITLCCLAAAPAHAQRCSDFRTCEEAMRSFRSGNTSLDRDKDGIPCESLCGGSGGGRSTAPAAPARNTGSAQPPTYYAPAPAAAPQPRRPRPPRPTTPQVSGPVALISVGDGDTIRVRGSSGEPVTIRLACIDAPETAQGQSGAEATSFLGWLLSGGNLEVRPQTVDRYGRTVAEVYSGGRNVNLEMVRLGQAYAYRDYLRGCDENAYLSAESQAQQSRQGVWRWGNEVKPWDFRRSR